MIMVTKALDDLRQDMASDVNGCPVFRWHENGDEEARLYNDIAAEVARGYSEGRFSYEFGDFVVNALTGSYIGWVGDERLEMPYPALLFRVYDAFDAGEYASPSLPPHDPIKLHTDPMIADIVASL
jgi:hypothetical protein